MTDKRYNTFAGNGESTEFYLDSKDVNVQAVELWEAVVLGGTTDARPAVQSIVTTNTVIWKLKWMLLLVVVLLMALPAVALADDGIASPEFFTWEMLATYAGAVLATTLIVQLTKGIGFIDRLPTRIYSYFIAVIVLVLAALFTNTLQLL